MLGSNVGERREAKRNACFNLETWLLYSNHILHEASATYKNRIDDS